MIEPLLKPDRPGSDLQTVLRVLREQRYALGGFFSAVVVTALVGSLLVAPRYEAVAVLLLLPRAGQEMDIAEVVENEPGYLESRDRARTQIQIISSRSVLEEVARRYDALDYPDLPATPDPVDVLRSSVSAAPLEDTKLVQIAVTDGDPERAAVLANLVAEVYTASRLTARTGAAKEALAWLEGRAQTSREALAATSAAVIAFKERNEVVDIDETVDGISARMSALQTALGAATTERVLLGSKLEEHLTLLARRDHGVLAGLFSDPALETMVKEQATIRTRNAGVRARYGAKHPEYLRAAEHARRVEQLIATEVQRIVSGERAQVETLERQEREITDALDEVKAELLQMQRLRARHTQLKLEEERAQRLHGAIAERAAEVELQAASNLNDVQIVDRALRPTDPISPNLVVNLAVAVALGLAGGVALALLRHRLGGTIRSAANVAHAIDRPRDGERTARS